MWGPSSSSYSHAVPSTGLHVGVRCCHGDVEFGVVGGLWAGPVCLSLLSRAHTYVVFSVCFTLVGHGSKLQGVCPTEKCVVTLPGLPDLRFGVFSEARRG